VKLKDGDGWVTAVDETDVLPDSLKADARRRRAIVRIGTPIAVVFALLVAVMLGAADWLSRVWLYQQTIQLWSK